MGTDADRWEAGCRADAVRNDFVIPGISSAIEKFRPSQILDVGAGTGYVARMVDSRLDYRPHWTLIDTNKERLLLAASLCPVNMDFETVVDDIVATSKLLPHYDAIVATFTFLELSDISALMRVIAALAVPLAPLIIAIPDVWRDVLAASERQADIISRHLEGPVEIPKIDKFTGDRYPFHIVRTETLISTVISAGFQLCHLTQSSPDTGGTFLMVFRKASCGDGSR